MTPRELIENGVKQYGITADSATIEQLEKYSDMLLEKNKVMNLTAITDPYESAQKHILDSLAIPKFADMRGKRVIDIGCGAGFPGAPIKIFEPDVILTLLDSTEKKLNFIRESLNTLGINADIVCGRAEEQSCKPQMREQFDFAVSRAVAPMNILAELCLPFVKVGGSFIAMKSVNSDDEIEAAQHAMKTLGGQAPQIIEYKLYPSDITHRLVIIKKVKTTDKKYPRRFGQIKNKPL